MLGLLNMRAMTASIEHLETQQIGTDTVGEHAGEGWWATRVFGPGHDQRWAIDAAQVWTEVKHLTFTLEEMDRDGRA